MTRAAALLCLLTALPVGASAQAGDPGEVLRSVRESLLYARYEEAVASTRALLGRTDLSASERNDALEAKAIAELALDQNEEAEATLRELYGRDPAHRLSDADASPTVQAAFARVREARPDTVPVRIDHVPPGSLANRESPGIDVTITTGADAVEELRLAHRTSGETRYDAIVMRRTGPSTAFARIPLLTEREDGYVVEYFVEALSPSRSVIARAGSRSEPFQVTIPEPSTAAPILVANGAPPSEPADTGGSVFSEWWLWAAIVAVVGGGVAAYVLLGPPSEGPTEGTFGTTTLSLR